MPELPEVETIRNELTPQVIGRTIKAVTLLWERMLRRPSPEEFHFRIAGRKITGLDRRGKYLLFELDGGDWLIIHLKMSGALILGDDSPLKYTRAILKLDDGRNIYFCDPRKFGRIQLVSDKNAVLKGLGVEPLQKDFTARMLGGLLKKRRAPVKAVLIDQSLIAGIGNMYADEALFAAKINPLRPADGLSQNEIKRLHKAIRMVLKIAIDSKGASVSNYFRPGGEKGGAHSHFRVAHRKGKPCPVCGSPIRRIPIRQRGSCYCPGCQPGEIE